MKIKWDRGTDEELDAVIVTSINLFYTWAVLIIAMVALYITLKVSGIL
jgi:hypothetical protein